MKTEILYFILFTIFIIVGSFYLSYYVVNRELEKQGKEKYTLIGFLNNNTTPTFKNVLIGMSFGMVFGFIDNLGLWFGLQTFEKYIPGGILTKSAWGNTYSDGLGATLGTSISIILRTLYPIENTPIWVDTLGVVLGCILGIYIPKYLTGKN
jgi:hypothetical protein